MEPQTGTHAGGWRQDGLIAILLGCMVRGLAADSPSVKLFDLPGPQLRSVTLEQPRVKAAPTGNAPAPVEELVLQTKAASEIDLLVQRHEAMNGRSPLWLPPVPRASSRFQRTLDSLLPAKGAFFQGNPNVLSSPLRMSEYWAK
jgi:hypothetical protein